MRGFRCSMMLYARSALVSECGCTSARQKCWRAYESWKRSVRLNLAKPALLSFVSNRQSSACWAIVSSFAHIRRSLLLVADPCSIRRRRSIAGETWVGLAHDSGICLKAIALNNLPNLLLARNDMGCTALTWLRARVGATKLSKPQPNKLWLTAQSSTLREYWSVRKFLLS